jgi:hypothetical protein
MAATTMTAMMMPTIAPVDIVTSMRGATADSTPPAGPG